MYLVSSACISAQQTFDEIDLRACAPATGNRLYAREPMYRTIPASALRRMGKAVRIASGVAGRVTEGRTAPDGIIVGTANGGMEDCIKFLNQIMQYDEGTLTPTNFVQSTPNAIASNISMSTRNHGYNITHVHRGLAFENALNDAQLFLAEHSQAKALVAGIDEISDYNYNIEDLGGWYKQEVLHSNLYESYTHGTIAGEGCAAFILSNHSEQALAAISGIEMLHTENPDEVLAFLNNCCLRYHIEPQQTLFVSGHNCDSRFDTLHHLTEQYFKSSAIVRFKHFFGEFPTVSALALWLSVQFLQNPESIPDHFIYNSGSDAFNTVVIYNHYKGAQHGVIILKKG